jgi:hypothetical protein
VFVSYDIEPFLPSALSHSSSASAYPPSRLQVYLPTNLYFAWSSPLSDEIVIKAIRESERVLTNTAIQLGQPIQNAASYSNYAESSTPLQDIYGSNLPALKALKAQYDPADVMGLAGGFKIRK